MDLKTLKGSAAAHVKSMGGDASAALFNKGLRTNLITLLCQCETIETIGTVDVFGGDKDVTGNIAKAVFNLFCVAEVLGIDLPTGIEKALVFTAAKVEPAAATAGTTADSKAGEKAAESKEPVKSGPEASAAGSGQKASATETASEATGKASSHGEKAADGGENKELKLQMYRQAFAEAKSPDDADRIWKKDVGGDKAITGKDKAALQKDYTEAKKRLK